MYDKRRPPHHRVVMLQTSLGANLTLINSRGSRYALVVVHFLFNLFHRAITTSASFSPDGPNAKFLNWFWWRGYNKSPLGLSVIGKRGRLRGVFPPGGNASSWVYLTLHVCIFTLDLE